MGIDRWRGLNFRYSIWRGIPIGSMGLHRWNRRETERRFLAQPHENSKTIRTERADRSVRAIALQFVLADDSVDVLRCEVNLISTINVRNCLKFYKVAEEIGAQVLQTHCSQLISTHWVKCALDFDITLEFFIWSRMILRVRIFNIYRHRWRTNCSNKRPNTLCIKQCGWSVKMFSSYIWSIMIPK